MMVCHSGLTAFAINTLMNEMKASHHTRISYSCNACSLGSRRAPVAAAAVAGHLSLISSMEFVTYETPNANTTSKTNTMDILPRGLVVFGVPGHVGTVTVTVVHDDGGVACAAAAVVRSRSSAVMTHEHLCVVTPGRDT